VNGFRLSRRSAQQGFTLSWRSAQQGFTLSWRSAQQGFTLIEMLVVLVVLGLVAMVAAQKIGRRPESVIRNEAEARLDAAIQGARREAGRTGSIRTVAPSALIEGASLSGALPSPGSRAGLILLYPDGSSNGGVVSIAGKPLASIDWLTAQVRDAQ
jgi:prepilin-type N-terminal cleavage/methylation domain-containing protein